MDINPFVATLLIASGLLMGCPNKPIQEPDGGPCSYHTTKGVFILSQYHMEDDTVYGLTFTERLDTTTADTAQKMVLAATEFCDATHYRYCDKLGFDSLINLKTPIYLEKMRLLSGSCNPDIPVEVSLLKDKIE